MNDRQANPPEDAGLMSIGEAVKRLQRHYSSVTQSSLRFLEREGLVIPTRTRGGHRLYSPEDVERLLQIKSWQDQRQTLDMIRSRLRERDSLPDPEELSRTFLDLIIDRRLMEARALVLRADSLGMPLATTFEWVLQPTLFEIGARWESGDMLVAQEKEASELVRDIVALLSHRHDMWRPGAPALVAGSVQGERHELGLRMVSGLLRERGCRVHFLGADVAAEFFAEAVALHHPAAVLLSVRLESNVNRIAEVVEGIGRASPLHPTPPVLVGGEAVPYDEDALDHMDFIPIHGAHLEGLIDVVMSHVPSDLANSATS